MVDMIAKLRDWIWRGRVPWRVRLAQAVARGFMRNPFEALRRVRSVNLDMKSIYRYKLHIHGKDFLKDFLSEAQALGMRPFLLWGSLLGCVREGRFIDHDYDIDFAILEPDYDQKDALIRAMRRRGYRLRHDRPYQFSFNTSDGLLHLDVDYLYPQNGKLVSSMLSEETGRAVEHVFDPKAIGSLRRAVFMDDVPVWVPERAEDVLTAMYGDWRTPVREYDYRMGPQNKRGLDKV